MQIKSQSERAFNAIVFATRISRFISKLPPQSVAIFVSNPERLRSNDTTFQYRQSSDILYLNGFPEPESALVVTNFGGKDKVILFVRAKDPSKETWTGIRIGVDGARKQYGADEAYPTDQFTSVVKTLAEKAENVYYRFGVNSEFDPKFITLWQTAQKPLFNPEAILHEMRLRKSDEELALIHRACAISVDAHRAAMQRCAPGLMEYQLAALMESIFADNGATFPAYTSIVASGNNACVLHYVSNNCSIRDGQLVLIDAACEYRGCASDITRTFPANGKFTLPQRQIYELVLEAQLAAITAAKPGKTLLDVHDAASTVLRRGLVSLGILPPAMGNKQTAKKIYRQAVRNGTARDVRVLGSYFMHGTSHWMGLDVHDPCGTRTASGALWELEPGMVFTVEPGLYFNALDKQVPAKYRGIGVRIEDDVVITADGCEILTAGVPKTIDAIEQLMAAGQ